MGCRVDHAEQWAIRIMHHASLFDHNSFITLTYDDKHLPTHKGLQYPDVQKFIKRLRKKIKISYYCAGEYGSITGRPHYHAAIFNEDWHQDRYVFKRNAGNTLYESPTLTAKWGLGSVQIGELNHDSAAYLAKYMTKALTGDDTGKYNEIINPETGEIWKRPKEFAHMSLNPAIAKDWLRLYWPDVQNGYTIVKGKQRKIPKYYRNYFKNTDHATTILNNTQEALNPTRLYWEHREAQEAILIAQHKGKRNHE